MLLEEVRADAERHGAEIGLKVNGNLKIRVRPMAIRRCVGNLVANAQRHADHVAIAADRELKFVSIIVDDDGEGIPPTYREEVFRPFFRLKMSRVTKMRAGLGWGSQSQETLPARTVGDIALSDSPMGGTKSSCTPPHIDRPLSS